jgi:hypothetical protein
MPPLRLSRLRRPQLGLHRVSPPVLMLSSWLSSSVLTLRRPHRALSRVCFVSVCPPLAPLHPPYVGARLPRPCCCYPHPSGRCPSSSPMVPVPSSFAISFCDGRALARANHQHLTVRLGQRHVHWLRRPPSAADTCTCYCSGPTTCLGPSPWEIYPVLPIPFFLIASSANNEE